MATVRPAAAVWPRQVRNFFLVCAVLLFPTATASAATPLGIGETRTNISALKGDAIKAVMTTAIVPLLSDPDYAACPMTLVATGRDREAILTERKLQQGPAFDPATRARGKLTDPEYLIDIDAFAKGDNLTWDFRVRHAKTGKTLLTLQRQSTQAAFFNDIDDLATPLLSAICSALQAAKPPRTAAQRFTRGRLAFRAIFSHADQFREANGYADLKRSFSGHYSWSLTSTEVAVLTRDGNAVTYRVKGTAQESGRGQWNGLKQIFGTCGGKGGRQVTQTLEERGTVALAAKTTPNWFFDVTVVTMPGARTYGIRLPPFSGLLGEGRWDNKSLCDGSTGGHPIRGGHMYVGHTLPPADPMIEGTATATGAISIKRTFSGKSPFFVWANMQHAHPDHLDGKYAGTFALELTLE